MKLVVLYEYMNFTGAKTTGTGTDHTTYIYQVFKFLKFSSFLSKVLWFQENVENGIIMTSRNYLHELPSVILE